MQDLLTEVHYCPVPGGVASPRFGPHFRPWLSHRNIYDYFYFGQESVTPLRTTPALQEVIRRSLVHTVPPQSVFVAPDEKTEGNRLFTFDFWHAVVDRLLSAGVKVSLNTVHQLWPELTSPLLRPTAVD